MRLARGWLIEGKLTSDDSKGGTEAEDIRRRARVTSTTRELRRHVARRSHHDARLRERRAPGVAGRRRIRNLHASASPPTSLRFVATAGCAGPPSRSSAIPKSTIFTERTIGRLRSSMSTLLGSRSRCTTPSSSIAASATATRSTIASAHVGSRTRAHRRQRRARDELHHEVQIASRSDVHVDDAHDVRMRNLRGDLRLPREPRHRGRSATPVSAFSASLSPSLTRTTSNTIPMPPSPSGAVMR